MYVRLNTHCSPVVLRSSSNLDALIRACRMLSAMDPDSLDGDGLKDAAKNLADAMGGLFNYTRPENWEDRCVGGLCQEINIWSCVQYVFMYVYLQRL